MTPKEFFRWIWTIFPAKMDCFFAWYSLSDTQGKELRIIAYNWLKLTTIHLNWLELTAIVSFLNILTTCSSEHLFDSDWQLEHRFDYSEHRTYTREYWYTYRANIEHRTERIYIYICQTRATCSREYVYI